jgi:hypothetical protein
MILKALASMVKAPQYECKGQRHMYPVEERLNQCWIPINNRSRRMRLRALVQARCAAAEAHKTCYVIDLDPRSVTDIVKKDSVQPSAWLGSKSRKPLDTHRLEGESRLHSK